MRRCIFFGLASSVILLIPHQAFPAYLRNVPVSVIQPGGDTVHCLASGDEYYNWLHDASGFTIMKNPRTGFYEYATLQQGKVVCTGAVAGRVDPFSLGIQKYAIAPPQVRQSLRSNALARAQRPAGAPTTGTIQNLVVFIRFSDQSEFTDPLSTYTELFDGTSPSSTSLLAYYSEVSYNQLMINSTFYPLPSGDQIISYQDIYPHAYFEPYDANSNPGGYQSAGMTGREDSLLLRAVNAVKSQVPGSVNIDANGDGFIDNICFIVEGETGAWADLLWPHRGSLPGGSINGKNTGSYNLNIQGFIAFEGSSVLCHEMFHTLGAPDLYHYSYDGYEPVGGWDIMAYNSSPPQHMGAYMKYRYGHWINSLPEIWSPGSYTLQPITSATNNCFKIVSLQSPTEYYIVEYRKRGGLFESSLSGDGLLVYRINTAIDGAGDALGQPDEVYIYRQGGTAIADGDYTTANMSVQTGRTSLNDNTDPSGFLSSGSRGGLDISSIGYAVSSISFNVNGPLPIVLSSFTAVASAGGSVSLQWKTLSETNNYGFLVERKGGQDTVFTAIQGSFVAGHGTTIQPQQYQWTDVTPPPLPLQYRLRQMNLDGSFHYSESVTVELTSATELSQIPAVFSLKQNYPNPFNPLTIIEFTVGSRGPASLTVYNVLGQSVGTLYDGEADPGRIYRLKFDGTNLASGVYFYRLQAGSVVETKRLLFMR